MRLFSYDIYDGGHVVAATREAALEALKRWMIDEVGEGDDVIAEVGLDDLSDETPEDPETVVARYANAPRGAEEIRWADMRDEPGVHENFLG